MPGVRWFKAVCISRNMENEEFKQSSEIAFEELRKLVSEDTVLSEEIRLAFLDDLSSSVPNEFSILKQTLDREKKEELDDLPDEPQSQ